MVNDYQRNCDDMLTLVPDQDMLVNPETTEYDHMCAVRASDGSYAYIYSTGGKKVEIDLTKMAGEGDVEARWYSPRNGAYSDAGRHEKIRMTFDPPGGEGVDNDWVLVLTAQVTR